MTKTLLSAAVLALSLTGSVSAYAGEVDFFDQLGTRHAPSGGILTAGSTNQHFYTSTSNLWYVVNEFAWDLKSEMEMNPGAAAITVTYAATETDAPETLFTIPAESAVFEIEPAFPAFNLDGIFGMYLTDEQKEYFKEAGEYVINFPAGYFTVGSDDVAAFTIAITATGAVTEEYPFEVWPEDGSTVDSLSEITITFPTATNVTYCDGKISTLTNSDGTVNLKQNYPKINGNTLIFGFTAPADGWPAGEYTFTVFDKQICVNPDIYFDESESGNGNVGAITVKYVVAPSVKYGDLADVLELGIPDDLEANRKNTVTQYGQSGMGIVYLNTNKPVQNLGGYDMIVYTYKESEDAESEVLNVMNPNDPDSGMLVMGTTPSIDYGEVGGDIGTSLICFLFAQSFDDQGLIVDPSQFPKYSRNGLYTLEIPDGVFGLADGTVLRGITLTYAYDDSEDVYGTGYTLTPEPGRYESASDLFDYDSKGITITFPEAKFVDSYNKVATLTLPDGKVIYNNQPKGGYYKNYLTLTFGLRNVDWDHEGEYVLEVLPEAIGLDQGDMVYWEYNDITPNFPGLKAVYVIDGSVGICAVGMDKAESYTVCTLDGKVILSGAKYSALTTLNSGIYVINGKKVQILK